MHFDIITIFPHLFDSFLNESLIKKSIQKKLNNFCVHDLRQCAVNDYGQVDERPYGGGPGMILMAEPILKTLNKIKAKNKKNKKKKSKIVLLSPAGKQFDQKMAERFSQLDQLIFICGRYEGCDARVEKFIDEKVSVGPYVLSGGELPAMTIMEAVARLIPGYLGNPESLKNETHQNNKKEYPQYTRPEILTVAEKKYRVPKILLSGHHQKIKDWQAKHQT
jgi:tRNA (guanine-N1)-methyltransferase